MANGQLKLYIITNNLYFGSLDNKNRKENIKDNTKKNIFLFDLLHLSCCFF